jgi:hypothetical protein
MRRISNLDGQDMSYNFAPVMVDFTGEIEDV